VWGPLAAILTLAGFAHARVPQVSVEVRSCVDIASHQVEELAALELSAALVEERQATHEVTRVVVTCQDSTVELEVTDPVSGKLLSRSVDLSQVEQRARARVLALAIAELVTSSWMEVELTPEPAIAPREAVASAEEREAARSAARERVQPASFVLFAEGGLRWFTSGFGPLWGGGVRLVDQGGNAGVFAALDFTRGSEAIAGGELGATLLSGALGYSLHLRGGGFTLSAVPGARLGWALLEGRPDAGSAYTSASFNGLWGGPLLRLGADYKVPSGFALGAGVEGGAALAGLGARVEGSREATLSDAWIAITLAVGLGR
jgi:hypothetical protein